MWFNFDLELKLILVVIYYVMKHLLTYQWIECLVEIATEDSSFYNREL